MSAATTRPPAFQSTPPHGGRPTAGTCSTRSTCRFNPRPRTGGDSSRGWRITSPSGFNPRPRTGGDVDRGVPAQPAAAVSIHAPARGATAHGDTRDGLELEVSIHAPARGATRASWWATSRGCSFNPRPRTGGDPNIAAAARAAGMFQSTPPHGGRPDPPDFPRSKPRFQSTPPHGGRLPIGKRGRGPPGSFNPRPRTGGDRGG